MLRNVRKGSGLLRWRRGAGLPEIAEVAMKSAVASRFKDVHKTQKVEIASQLFACRPTAVVTGNCRCNTKFY